MDTTLKQDSLPASPASGVSYIALLLFAIEMYHMISHFCILFRVRMLPKRDLVRVKMYFLVDLLSVSACMLYTREMIWLGLLQNLQHAFFYFTWNKNWYCIRVIDWSSLDWKIKPLPEQEGGTATEAVDKGDRLDVTLGTAFDMCVHIVFSSILMKYLSVSGILVSLALVALGVRLVLFNKSFSWSNPTDVPKWVAKRIIDLDVATLKSE